MAHCRFVSHFFIFLWTNNQYLKKQWRIVDLSLQKNYFFFYKQTNNILRNLNRTPPHNIQTSTKALVMNCSFVLGIGWFIMIIGRKVFKLDERWSAQFEMWRKWCSEVSVVGRIQSLDGVKQLIKCPGKKIFFWMWSLLLT